MVLEVIALLKVLFRNDDMFGYEPILKAHLHAVVLMDTISGDGKENTTYCK